MTRTYQGGCHCGVIRWTFRTILEPSEWVVRSCQCSFCRAHGARCTSDPAGTVDFFAPDHDALSHYRFGLKSADFLVCTKCGVYVGAMIKSSAGAFATLNLNSMKSSVKGVPESTPVFYDSEEREDRIARRLSLWTPVTTVV
jgi:hypothetical protein